MYCQAAIFGLEYRAVIIPLLQCTIQFEGHAKIALLYSHRAFLLAAHSFIPRLTSAGRLACSQPQTTPGALEAVLGYGKRIGKTTVSCGDTPGMYVQYATTSRRLWSSVANRFQKFDTYPRAILAIKERIV